MKTCPSSVLGTKPRRIGLAGAREQAGQGLCASQSQCASLAWLLFRQLSLWLLLVTQIQVSRSRGGDKHSDHSAHLTIRFPHLTREREAEANEVTHQAQGVNVRDRRVSGERTGGSDLCDTGGMQWY